MKLVKLMDGWMGIGCWSEHGLAAGNFYLTWTHSLQFITHCLCHGIQQYRHGPLSTHVHYDHCTSPLYPHLVRSLPRLGNSRACLVTSSMLTVLAFTISTSITQVPTILFVKTIAPTNLLPFTIYSCPSTYNPPSGFTFHSASLLI